MTDAAHATEEIIAKLKSENIRLRRRLDALRHRQSGTYNFRWIEVRDMSRGTQAIEQGDSEYGLRLLADVLDDLHPEWRSF